jgi:hypothetical protein
LTALDAVGDRHSLGKLCRVIRKYDAGVEQRQQI